jgi:exopolysaccharide biosynthesis protein
MLKKYRMHLAYVLLLTMFTTYVFLDTFVITRVYGDASDGSTEAQQELQADEEGAEDQTADTADDSEAGNMHSGQSGSGSGHGPGSGSGKGPGKHRSSSDSSSDSSGSTGSSDTTASSSSTTYSDGNITVTLKEYRENDSTIYVADVQLTDSSYLKTALAQGSYGRNVTETTSEIAESVNAILAVNGDYYGAQEKGYVIRNGTLYRDTAIANQEDLVIYEDGSFGIINESDVSAQELIEDGAVQTLSFGPALVQNGTITVSENEEVGQAMASNPRTAIGIIDDNHYVFVVSDGRTSESAGLSLYELAAFMDSLGVKTAYNLDGGGSSTMYFNGSVVNNPTTGGGTTRERSVSDIVYIG